MGSWPGINLVFKVFLVSHPHLGPRAHERERALSSLWEFSLCSTHGSVWGLSGVILCRHILKVFDVLLWFSSTHAQLIHEPKSSCIDLGAAHLSRSFFSMIYPVPSGSKPPFYLGPWLQSWGFIFPAWSHIFLNQVCLRGETAGGQKEKNNQDFSLHCPENTSFISTFFFYSETRFFS